MSVVKTIAVIRRIIPAQPMITVDSDDLIFVWDNVSAYIDETGVYKLEYFGAKEGQFNEMWRTAGPFAAIWFATTEPIVSESGLDELFEVEMNEEM